MIRGIFLDLKDISFRLKDLLGVQYDECKEIYIEI